MLTKFGKILNKINQLHYSAFYQIALKKLSKVLALDFAGSSTYKSIISGKKIIVLGSGKANEAIFEYVQSMKDEGAVLVGTAWSAQIYKNIDVHIVAHCAHIISAMVTRNRPNKLLQAVTFPTVGIYKNVDQIQRVHISDLSLDEVINLIEDYQTGQRGTSAAVLSLSNAMFLGIFLALMHGAREIELVGFDPMAASYGFSEESRAVLLAELVEKNGAGLDPVLGSSSQLPNEAVTRIRATITQGSSRCVERLDLLLEGMAFMMMILDHFNVPISAIGESEFMDKVSGLKRVRLD